MIYFKYAIFVFLSFTFDFCHCREFDDYDIDIDFDSSYDNECRGEKEPFHEYLGSYTPYQYRYNLNDSEVKIKGCKPVKIFLLLRHGSKYPTLEAKQKFMSFLGPFQSQVQNGLGKAVTCRDESFKIYEYDWYVPFGWNGGLTKVGEDEISYFAHRTQKRFPSLFKEPFEKYELKYSNTYRGRKSIRSFLHGIDEDRLTQFIEKLLQPPATANPILLFDKTCKRWLVEILHNSSIYKPLKQFARSDDMLEVKNQISTRLGLRLKDNDVFPYLTPNFLQILFQVCRWHTSTDINLIKSSLCNAFSEKSARTMEFLSDLKYSILHGYSNELNGKIACYLFGYIVRSLNTSDTNVFVYFLKSGSMVKLLTHLGLYKDVVLINSDGLKTMKDRKWRMSKVNPQVANLVFILYNCRNQRKIQLMHLERPIHIPGCPHTDSKLCPFDLFMKIYNSSLYDCNYEQLCKLRTGYLTLPTIQNVDKYDEHFDDIEYK